MEKIANPQELAQELQTLLEYAQGPEPSREKLASDLRELANKVATADMPIIRAMMESYEAGFKAADPEAARALKDMHTELLVSLKRAMSATSRMPLAHTRNISSALWEFAYYWGGVAAQSE